MKYRDPRIDTYIAGCAEFARPILEFLRELVHEAEPEVEETIKWGMPYFDRHGLLCGMAAFKAHCSFVLWRGDQILGVERATRSDAMGQFGRISSLSDLPPREVLVGYVREAVRLNSSGERTRPHLSSNAAEVVLPAALEDALEAHPVAKVAFAGMSVSCRREYAEWIAEAKREETRIRRVAVAIEWIAEGKPRNWKYMKGKC